MASVRTTFTIDESMMEAARQLEVNVSAAARAGVAEAVRQAMIANDIAGYKRHPEEVDPVWNKLETWGDE